MEISRRTFLAATPLTLTALERETPRFPRAEQPTAAPRMADDRFDPWLEIDATAIRNNVAEVVRLSGGRPILAVLKNNAYGLGLAEVAEVLEALPEVIGYAVVKADEALTLRDAGVRKPTLLMGLFSPEDAPALVERGITLSAYTDDAAERLTPLARRLGRPVPVHLYLDTGMGRLGMPSHRALPWIADLVSRPDVAVEGAFMAFTEEADFDLEQLRRFLELRDAVKARGADLGRLHAASSNGVFHLPEAHLDMVRPGIAIFGGYPSKPEVERGMGTLRCAVRLLTRVVRVERLRAGDSVSYGRNYVAARPVYAATLPVGHADGYPRSAVSGGKVLIGGRLNRVIGAVSASHTIVEVGEEPTVRVGDVATLVGPDAPDIEPNRLADAIGVSPYDILMHLNPSLPRVAVG